MSVTSKPVTATLNVTVTGMGVILVGPPAVPAVEVIAGVGSVVVPVKGVVFDAGFT
jgi:hypothetical protein